MARDNGAPLDGWQVEPHPWDAARCCPADCPTICESGQPAAQTPGEDLWLSDTFTLGTE